VDRYRLGRLTLLSMEPDELFGIAQPGLRHVVTVNAEIFVLAHEQPAYAAVLAHTWNTIDGRPVQWLARWRNGGRAPKQLAGADLLEPLAAYCGAHGRRLFLLGASERANAGACARLGERVPGLVLGGYAPAMTADVAAPAWNAEIFAALAAFRPDYLVVAFGPPKADYWIARARPRLEALGVRFAAGFGGAVRFVAGEVSRAPRWVRWAGLEWLFRLAVEPRRLGRTLRLFRMPYHAVRARD
jgi:N-acetylglucosaminyldiphosphoundecaprenol N-acetyl-beta-D-mannosaminyltransferase